MYNTGISATPNHGVTNMINPNEAMTVSEHIKTKSIYSLSSRSIEYISFENRESIRPKYKKYHENMKSSEYN